MATSCGTAVTASKEEAPGWAVGTGGCGPVCWKCKGTGVKPAKKRVAKSTCAVCGGSGQSSKRSRQEKHEGDAGKVRSSHRPPPDNWIVPGPGVRGGLLPEAGEELCCLLGHWRIFQRVGGHRWSTDDLVTAWWARKEWERRAGAGGGGSTLPPERCLDLGCGIGSVLMMTAWGFPAARCVGIEAQCLSTEMARRSVRYNGADGRCTVHLGDIREAGALPSCDAQPFELVTGTPPYFKVDWDGATGAASAGMGGLPTCEQSAPARYEFRGGIEAYCEASARWLAPGGVFVVCEGWLQNNAQRVPVAARLAGLDVLTELQVHGRDDKPPLFAVYSMSKRVEGAAAPEPEVRSLVVRFKGGRRSEEYVRLMREMGIWTADA